MFTSLVVCLVAPLVQSQTVAQPTTGMHAAAVDVPLSLWTSPAWPDGKVFGPNFGLSLGDWDGDGWVDVFVMSTGKLFRNIQGHDWQLVADLSPLLMPGSQYGAVFGDFDGNGFPDLASEPRKYSPGTGCLSLLQNSGKGTFFREIADKPWRIDVQPCGCYAETNNWGDVDGDGLIDLFMPVYPQINGSIGNRLLKNLGPITPSGEYAFSDVSAFAGVANVPGANRPEGAQLVDMDFDGDLDLYANEVIYQNVSTLGVPHFQALAPAESGVTGFGILDEGAALCDYDMDGDIDLLVAFTSDPWATIYENRGDGTFFTDPTVVDNPSLGVSEGLSLGDWDMDGDVDWTTGSAFRRNRLIEDGVRHFTIGTTNLNPGWIGACLPCWVDWDRDGDLDCCLGHYAGSARMLQNDTWNASTPLIDRRYVRIRPMRPSTLVPLGLDNEFGAMAEVTLVQGTGDGHRRVKFVESGQGYLGQSEYALTFGLPTTPTDLVFNVSVDFPVVSQRGIWRVDERVNPALGAIHLATLLEREIQVLRDGRVRVNGVEYAPLPGVTPWLEASGGGLALAVPGHPLAAPTPTLFPDAWAILGVSTATASKPIIIRQIDLDGGLDSAVSCDGVPANIVLWDVTDPAHPKSLAGDRLSLSTDPRNYRSHPRTNLVLQPGREYRLAARVTSFRGSPITGALTTGGLLVRGAALVQSSTPCGGAEIANVALDASMQLLDIRVAQ